MIDGTLSTLNLRLPTTPGSGSAQTSPARTGHARTDPTGTDPTGSDITGAVSAADRKALHRKAVEFESVYLSEMLKPMFENLQAAAPFDGGFGEDVWHSMQLQQFGQAIAKSGGVGLADRVYSDLLAAQEARSRGSR